MDLSRIGMYFFVLYIYSCLGIDWFDFCWMVQFRYIWEANKRILFVRRGRLIRWKEMSPRISFLTKFWIYFESMKRIWTNLIFGKIVIGFERIENDPINYLNSKTLKRPRYLYESLISIRNIRWKLFLETLLKFSPIRNTCCCFFVARCLVPTLHS